MEENPEKRVSYVTPRIIPAKILEAISNHYGLIIATSSILFSAACLIYSDAFFNVFGIDFFSFGSFSDIYRTPMSHDIETALILISCLIIGLIISQLDAAPTSPSSKRYYKKYFLVFERFKINILVVRIFFIGFIYILFFMLIPYFFYIVAIAQAKNIKEGFSARYEIIFQGNTLKCKSIIGSTSDYVFLFDYIDLKPIIITRSEISKITLLINNAPPKQLYRTRHRTPTKSEEAALVKRQIEWSKEIKISCGETISWPTF